MRFRIPPRPGRPDLPVQRGESLLAHASGPDGAVVGGTRDALYLPRRLPWETIATAEWDQDEAVLRVVEIAPWGERPPEHRIPLDESGRLLELVRERVTASIVVQRHVPVRGRHGVRIVGRRAPGRRGETTWLVEYDAAIDPSDPAVRRVVDVALADARADVGE